jgi:hypothetical protein
MSDPSDAFGLFVSCVEGQPVPRFGTKVLIGAVRDPEERRKIRYNTKAITAIPVVEARKYAREYQRAIADGSLTERTAAQWIEQEKHIREVGAPREKLKTAEPAQRAKDPIHGHSEGGSKLG